MLLTRLIRSRSRNYWWKFISMANQKHFFFFTSSSFMSHIYIIIAFFLSNADVRVVFCLRHGENGRSTNRTRNYRRVRSPLLSRGGPRERKSADIDYVYSCWKSEGPPAVLPRDEPTPLLLSGEDFASYRRRFLRRYDFRRATRQ